MLFKGLGFISCTLFKTLHEFVRLSNVGESRVSLPSFLRSSFAPLHRVPLPNLRYFPVSWFPLDSLGLRVSWPCICVLACSSRPAGGRWKSMDSSRAGDCRVSKGFLRLGSLL